jgi:hypothetical protein
MCCCRSLLQLHATMTTCSPSRNGNPVQPLLLVRNQVRWVCLHNSGNTTGRHEGWCVRSGLSISTGSMVTGQLTTHASCDKPRPPTARPLRPQPSAQPYNQYIHTRCAPRSLYTLCNTNAGQTTTRTILLSVATPQPNLLRFVHHVRLVVLGDRASDAVVTGLGVDDRAGTRIGTGRVVSAFN